MRTDPPKVVLDERNAAPRLVNSSLAPKWAQWAAFVLVSLFGFALRLPQLGARPMHTDEAVNAYIVGQLLAGKSFSYDPQDRHGPMLAALALPLARLQGATAFADLTESELRLTTVLAGTLTILLFGAAVEMFGFFPCLIAALLFAGAPLPVYYDRYFIHESLFVAATFGLILSAWCARRTHSAWQAALAGGCAALMLAGKETALLHFFALGVAAIVFWHWNLRGKSTDNSLRSRTVLTVVAVFLILSIILFTWFGSNWKALSALFEAVPDFFARAGGEGHQKPFWYFAQLLSGGWSGALILSLACIGFFQTVKRRETSAYSFLAFYALFLGILYSLIPYKTPWLALNFWLPITLFAGLAAQSLWRIPAKYPARRIAVHAGCIVMAAVAATMIAHDTHQRVFLHPADETNPYAYAHTSDDVLGLAPEIEKLAHQNAIASPRIAVIAADPWPLPRYACATTPNVGFWQPGQQPESADFYITSTRLRGSICRSVAEFPSGIFLGSAQCRGPFMVARAEMKSTV